MRNFYALALLFLSLSVNAQNVTITASEFKNILVNTICADTNDDGMLDSDVDTNNDGQIQTAEAQAVYHLNTLGLYAKNLGGIDAFIHLKSLVCAGSGLLFINISGLNQLKSIDCSGAGTYSITLSGLTQLETLNCSNNELMTVLNFSGLDQLKNLNCANGRITNLNLAPYTLLETLNCAGNQLNTITFAASNNLQSLNCSRNSLANFDYSVVTNLKILNCSQTQSSSLEISALAQLQELNCSNNQLTGIDLASHPALVKLECASNSITSLDLSQTLQLKTLSCFSNQLTALSLSQNVNLETINCDNNQISSLDTSGLLHLKSLSCIKNAMGSLNINSAVQLEEVSCYENNLSALDVSNLIHLKSLTCQKNQLTALTVAHLSELKTLNCSINNLSAVDFTDLMSIETLDCSQNNLSAISTGSFNQIKTLNCNNNHIVGLGTSAMTNLETLQCGSNELTELTIINLPNLKKLDCSNNHITAMDFGTSSNLYKIELGSNLFTTLDFSELQANGKSFRYNLTNNPNLTYVNIKNGCSLRRYSYQDTTGFYASDCPNIQFVCADDNNLSRVSANPTTVVSSYCSFVPGGAYNTITGTLTLDLDNNGCDNNDLLMKHTKITLDESTVGGMSGATFTDGNGTYKFYTRAGLFNLTPVFENPYFMITPALTQIDFPALDGSTQTQNFCVSPNGIHNDVEVTILPGLLRPGFDHTLTLVYKNKGNQIMSGHITFNYDDATHDLISSDTPIDSQNQNSLSWNYTQLMPFETRYIHVTLNLNSPQETPAVNAGDLLYYTASITPVSDDETPLDNVFELTQMARGSYDPNDKTCLEGNTVTPEMVGKYLHYLIRFQNKGTAAAENIVVQDLIDETKFDISSLQLTGSSHPQTTKITDNKVEFLFQNINLPSEDENEPASHGYIAFKIKTRSDLVLGDVIENKANIYFDYNYPVETNTTSATVAPLLHINSFENTSVTVWPNPVKDVVRINAQAHINLLELLDAQGRILDSLTTNQTQIHFNLNQKSSGIYFVKIYTTQGIKVQKIIKE